MNALRLRISATRRLLVTSFVVLPCLTAAIIAGCGDDDDASPLTNTDAGQDAKSNPVDANMADNFVPGIDSGHEGGGPTDAGDAGVDAAALTALRMRGQYIVEAVVGCGDCHTPRDMTGKPIVAKALSGVDCFIDVDGPTDGGCLSSRNLTNDATGLANRSDDEIKNMFMNGKRPNGDNLNNVMPYYTLHNLKAEDADAIVAYLRTVTAVAHTVRPNDDPFKTPPSSSPIDPALIPSVASITDAGLEAGADLDNGRYLAQFACMECHTKHSAPGMNPALDMPHVFGGDEAFVAAGLGLPTGPGGFPDTIISSNITHDPSGIKDYTVGDMMKAMRMGIDHAGKPICPPMPIADFVGLSDKDALDIASYIHGVPNVANTIDGGSGSCNVPTGP